MAITFSMILIILLISWLIISEIDRYEGVEKMLREFATIYGLNYEPLHDLYYSQYVSGMYDTYFVNIGIESVGSETTSSIQTFLIVQVEFHVQSLNLQLSRKGYFNRYDKTFQTYIENLDDRFILQVYESSIPIDFLESNSFRRKILSVNPTIVKVNDQGVHVKVPVYNLELEQVQKAFRFSLSMADSLKNSVKHQVG
jgi:hypothetical protein